MEAPPHRSGIGCSGGVAVKKLHCAGILAVFFACFQAWPLRPGSSGERAALRLDVSFQCPQLESRLHQTVVVLPDFLLGPPVPLSNPVLARTLCDDYCITQRKMV